MHFFNGILTDVKDSFYNPTRYDALKNASSDKSLYFGLLATILGTLFFIASGISGYATLFKTDFVAKAVEMYPSELVVELRDGKLSANVSQPYIIPIPGDTQEDVTNALVLDTTKSLTMEEVRAYDAFLVADAGAAYIHDDNQFRVITFADTQKQGDVFVLDRAKVASYAAKAQPWITGGLIILPFIIIGFVLMFGLIYYLIMGVFGALVVKIISRLQNHRRSFGESFQIAMFAMIPVALFDFATDFIGLGNGFWPAVLVFVIVVGANLYAPAHKTAQG